MRRNQISLLLLCVVLISMPLVMHNTASSTGTASSAVVKGVTPKSNGAMDAILEVGSQLYYRVISEGPEVTNEHIIKYVVTDKITSEISYDMYEYVQISDTFWVWSYLDDQVENYTYDLFYHSYSIAPTLTSMAAVNQTENTDALFLASMSSSSMIYSSYSDALAPWHEVYLECYRDDDPENLVKIIWIANKTTGLVTYYEDNMETHNKRELIGFDITGYTHDQPNSFGLHVDDTIDIFRPEVGSGSKRSENEQAKWLRETVKFLYYDPYLNIDRIIIQEDIYSDPRMIPESLLQTQPLNTQSYVNRSNLNAVYGPFFYKDLNWQSTAFEDSLRAILTHDPPEGPGVVISAFTTGPDWAEITGVDHNEYDFTLFVQQLKNAVVKIGTSRYMSMIQRNSTTGEKFGEITIVIDCSAGGMISTSPSLGVVEGNWWTYLVEEHQSENYWASDENSSFNYQEDVLHYIKFTVTHIFAGNKTVMAVIGRMEMWSSDHPDPEIKGFEPFLVWDTTDPTSFMTMGGHTDRLSGPPVLLPQGVDWSTQATAMNILLGDIFESGTIKAKYQPQAIRIHVMEKEKTDEERYRHEETIILETKTNGVVAHLTRDYKDEYNFNNGTYSKGHNRRERFDAFLYNATFSSSLIDPATYTNIVPGNVFVWQRSSYRPYEEGNDPAHKEHSKVAVNNVISSYDGAVVFIGSRFWKNWDSLSYQPETWHTYDWENDTIIDTGMNLWLLGSIRPGDIWTWVRSQFYENTITDFASYTSTIVDILNVMLPLPPSITITMSDITTSGRSFQVSVTANEGGEDITYVMRWAMNDQGIMQDMFQGSKYDNGTWREWERQVLVGGSLATQYGEYFTNDIPSNYVPWDGIMTETGTTSTTTNPFGFEIPGYPPLIISIFALFGIIVIFRRMRKHY